MENWLIILPVALVSSTVAAIAGTGGGVILLPVLVMKFGIRDAVPMYTIAQLIGNMSRVVLNRQDIKLPVVGWFCLGAIPCAILGSWMFTKIPDSGLTRILGIFLIGSVVWRHAIVRPQKGFATPWFAVIGAMFSIISATVGSGGPFAAPFYISYGLVKGVFIGTEALGSAMMHVVKLVSYQTLGAIAPPVWLNGLFIGPVMIIGSHLGRWILERLPTHVFILVIEIAILLFGIWLLMK